MSMGQMIPIGFGSGYSQIGIPSHSQGIKRGDPHLLHPFLCSLTGSEISLNYVDFKFPIRFQGFRTCSTDFDALSLSCCLISKADILSQRDGSDTVGRRFPFRSKIHFCSIFISQLLSSLCRFSEFQHIQFGSCLQAISEQCCPPCANFQNVRPSMLYMHTSY